MRTSETPAESAVDHVPIILRKPSEQDGESLNYVSTKSGFDNLKTSIDVYNPTNTSV